MELKKKNKREKKKKKAIKIRPKRISKEKWKEGK